MITFLNGFTIPSHFPRAADPFNFIPADHPSP
jgi:hypothetical protein